MEGMNRMMKKMRAQCGMDAPHSWWVSGLLAADCETSWFRPEWRTRRAAAVRLAVDTEDLKTMPPSEIHAKKVQI